MATKKTATKKKTTKKKTTKKKTKKKTTKKAAKRAAAKKPPAGGTGAQKKTAGASSKKKATTKKTPARGAGTKKTKRKTNGQPRPSKNKTVVTKKSVSAFIASITDPQKKKDAQAVHKLMKTITGNQGRMWGSSIVGYGDITMTYATGRVVDWFYAGWSPRKQNMTLYIMDGFEGRDALMKRLGKHTTGVSCLYVKRLDDINEAVLKQLVTKSVSYMKKKYG